MPVGKAAKRKRGGVASGEAETKKRRKEEEPREEEEIVGEGGKDPMRGKGGEENDEVAFNEKLSGKEKSKAKDRDDGDVEVTTKRRASTRGRSNGAKEAVDDEKDDVDSKSEKENDASSDRVVSDRRGKPSKKTTPRKGSSTKTPDDDDETAPADATASSDASASASTASGDASRPYRHWLFKSEPESRFENGIFVKFGFEDLKAEPEGTACWDGVRNYQARNFMRDQMRVGDEAFFYHSNTKPPGVIGLIRVAKESYVDHTQFDRSDPHFDPKAKKADPKWFMVDVKYVRPLKRYLSLYELKAIHEKHKKEGGPLKNLALFTKARLSVQPLTEEEFDYIRDLENEEPQN